MIRTRKRQSYQPQHRVQKAFRLAQWQIEEQKPSERRFDGQSQVNRLSASLTGLQRRPCVDGVLADPQRNVTACAQRLLALAPVLNAVSRLEFGVSVPFLRLGHPRHRGLLG